MTLTQEGKDIVETFLNTDKHIIIKARAGCGKTTMLLELLKHIPESNDDKPVRTMFTAFNSHIAQELRGKVPQHVWVSTCHAIGKKAIETKYKDSKLDENKVDKLITKYSKKWSFSHLKDYNVDSQRYLYLIKKGVDLVRLTHCIKKEHFNTVIEDYELLPNPNLHSDYKSKVYEILKHSTNDKKTYDYVDMLYLPVVDNKIWLWQYDYVFVDELQDWSKIMFAFLKKMIKRDRKTNKFTGRLVAVGDDKQAIYMFAGADTNSFFNFTNFPNSKVLPLTTSWRCSKNVIKRAQTVVNDIQWAPNAKDGVCVDGNVFEAVEGDYVLCRNTKPLINLFFHFYLQGKKVYIKGRSMTDKISGELYNFSTVEEYILTKELQLKNLIQELQISGNLDYTTNQEYINIKDTLDSVNFIWATVNYGSKKELLDRLEKVFKKDGEGICLSTIHKSKGLEANNVYIVRNDILPLPTSNKKQFVQEYNLLYIAITRAKNKLVFDNEWSDKNETVESIISSYKK